MLMAGENMVGSSNVVAKIAMDPGKEADFENMRAPQSAQNTFSTCSPESPVRSEVRVLPLMVTESIGKFMIET